MLVMPRLCEEAVAVTFANSVFPNDVLPGLVVGPTWALKSPR